MTELEDPLSLAVKELFGLSYLFPYQRLVIANILEAAEARGIPLTWPAALTEHPAPVPQPKRRGEGVLHGVLEASLHGVLEASLQDSPPADDSDAVADEDDRDAPGEQIVILPTGAGKSLCFQLPAMLLSGPTLVIYPILSLMADQERRLRERGFAPVILRGAQDKEERRRIFGALREGESRFIIANPEVLLTESVLKELPSLNIAHIVIDEAHCVSEWGESFRPSYLRINEIIEAVNRNGAATGPGHRALVTAFTATAGKAVLEKIGRYIFGGEAGRIVGNPDRANIRYAAGACILRDLAVRDLILKKALPAIVFCSSRSGTEKLARYLVNSLAEIWDAASHEGRPAPGIKFYHAGLSREEKKAVEEWFFDNSNAVLVSTCAYGMGVDKADIRTVIHRDCPPSVEAYLQESGRAGRDGKLSQACLLWGPGDENRLRRVKDEAGRKRMESLLSYARTVSVCRREQLLGLLNYEGEMNSPESACCDVCDGNAGTCLREEQSLCGFFRRHGRSYTVNEAAALLADAKTIAWSESEAAEAIRFLVKAGKLKVIKNFFWKNKIASPTPRRRSQKREAAEEDSAEKNFPQ
ncbi:MAG: RecQ family ATP-dependent DNA helicase [Treponema sp.]|jgi:ATP-dependent DNA helicase RecQ|nr:RecQ family ATP-dependent DNA helicase [Treponema sp.]